MTIQFHAGSGSPYAWRVWLALEHKALPYELHMLSFQAGDLKKPEFVAINPRRKVPAIVDDGFALYESAAIVRYLEECYPDSGKSLFPGNCTTRAVTNRLIAEVDAYVAPAIEHLVDEILFKPEAERSAEAIAKARAELGLELEHFERDIAGEFLASDAISAADLSLYPLIALARRMQAKFVASLDVDGIVGPKLRAWEKRVEALPYFAKTIPPHWRA
ncbi:MAG: glutathione S-transferase family protein [Deltaproteobacteria bacterium]|nr:glutathione S-transferase family protein [Deltaproteobacteria bacterium]